MVSIGGTAQETDVVTNGKAQKKRKTIKGVFDSKPKAKSRTKQVF
jgi:hypothetical protein